MERKLSAANPPTKSATAVTPSDLHRRQMIWQVWLPLIASIVIVLVLAGLAIAGTVQGSSVVNHLGNISAVYLIIPVLIVGFVVLAINGGIIYGLSKLLKKVPLWMFIVRLRANQMVMITERGANAAVKPVMVVNTFDARVRAFLKKIFNKG